MPFVKLLLCVCVSDKQYPSASLLLGRALFRIETDYLLLINPSKIQMRLLKLEGTVLS